MKQAKTENIDNTDHNYGSNCELILCSKEGTPSPEAYQYFYQLMTTYRFPMRYSPKNQVLIKKMDKQDQTRLKEDELKFITNRLHEKFPDHNIITIPKTLYQLHAFSECLKPTDDERDNIGPDEFSIFFDTTAGEDGFAIVNYDFQLDNIDPSEDKSKLTEQTDFETYCTNMMNRPKHREFHRQINNAWIEKLKKTEPSLELADVKTTNIKTIVNFLIKELKAVLKKK